MTVLQPAIIGEWPRLDLAQRHLTALELRWRYSWPEIADVFGDLIYWTGAHSVTPYQRSKTRHFLSQSASGVDDFGAFNPELWSITATYATEHAAPVASIPKSLQHGQEFADVVADLDPSAPAAIHAQFAFSPHDAATSRMPLPLDYPAPSATLFDEITGIRGGSSGDDELGLPPYLFSWDLEADDTRWLSLDFELAAPPLAATAIIAYDTAVAIAVRFVDAPGLRAATTGKRR